MNLPIAVLFSLVAWLASIATSTAAQRPHQAGGGPVEMSSMVITFYNSGGLLHLRKSCPRAILSLAACMKLCRASGLLERHASINRNMNLHRAIERQP